MKRLTGGAAAARARCSMGLESASAVAPPPMVVKNLRRFMPLPSPGGGFNLVLPHQSRNQGACLGEAWPHCAMHRRGPSGYRCSMEIREMTVADYDAARALWQASAGARLSPGDAAPQLAAFLSRNPRLPL